MSLNEPIVEDAALTRFGEQTRCARTLIPTFSQREKEAIGHGPQMAPGEPAAERDAFGEVVLVGQLRGALRQLNPPIPQYRTLATLRDTLLPKLLSGELSVTNLELLK
jgi:hypothetical protein